MNVGAVVFTAHSASSSASNVQFTIAGSAPSASIGSMTVKVAGLNIAASQVAYANGAFSAATATVGGLKIDNNLFTIGAAGSTCAIPDINLGSTGVLKLTQNKGALNVLASGQYQFSVSSIVSISKVQTSGGGTNLTVAGTLKISNGAVSGSIAALAFKVSGVDFSASNMQFVGDKLTVGQAKLALSIAGKKTEATIHGLESDGFAPLHVAQGTILINDTTPPAAPTGLTAVTIVDMSATATWNGAAAEPDVAGYQFTVNGGDPIAVDGRLADYSTYGLTPGATHTISVAAYEYSGNLGAAATVTVTTPDFGVAAAWPLRDSANEAVTEIGASVTGPVTLGGFTLTDAQG